MKVSRNVSFVTNFNTSAFSNVSECLFLESMRFVVYHLHCVLAPSKHDSSDCVSFVQAGNLIIHLSVFEFLSVFFIFYIIFEHESCELQFFRTINTNSCINQSFINTRYDANSSTSKRRHCSV